MNESEQLIACLEGEIAKRDEELAACRVAVENCEVFRARIAELEADLRGYRDGAKAEADAGDEARAECRQLRAKLAFFTGYGHDPHPSDKLIELALINFGGKWDGDRWTIEDADLHPFVRSFAAPAPEAKAQGVALDGSQLAGLLEQVRLDDDEAKPHGSGATYWNNAVIACQVAIRDALAAPEAPEADAWIPVSERLPDSGSTVIAYYLNSYGKGRTIRAQHVEAWTIEAEDVADVDTDCVEYSEQDDCYYLLQGWYECIDNWDEYYRVAVTEGQITHWMPLPAAPIKIEANRHDQ